MNKEVAEWIVKAVEAVCSGLATKLEKDGAIVYKCGKVVRIDIKLEDANNG